MRQMNEAERKQIEWLVVWVMTKATGEYYARQILEHESGCGSIFMEDVIEDVMQTSAWNDEGYYNEDDIRLAIGRILMYRLGIDN